MKDGSTSVVEIFSSPEEMSKKDMIYLFPTKDGIILKVGEEKACNEGCSYDYKYYYVNMDGQYQEIIDFNQGTSIRDILSFGVIQ